MGRVKKDPAKKEAPGWAYTLRLEARDADIPKALKEIAAANYMSINNVIIHAIRIFVEEKKKGAKFTIELR